MALTTVILSAGQGKRMRSTLPKVLHHIGGKTLLEHVIHTVQSLQQERPIVIYGHGGEKVKEVLGHLNVMWVEQAEQLGTGHAVQTALPYIPDDHRVLVLYGDVPLINSQTLQTLISNTPAHSIGMITANLPNPEGFGRIIRDSNNNIINIIEEKDASDEQRQISEINSGIYLFPGGFLQKHLPNLSNQNAQHEYYLTDLIGRAVENKVTLEIKQPQKIEEILGVNDKSQLTRLERFYQTLLAEKLLQQGVTLYDPSRIDIRGELTVGDDTSIDINNVFEGHVTVGSFCKIGPNCHIRNTIIRDRVEIKANSVIDGAEIGDDCIVGPFARLRPGTVLAPNVHIGNFVEVKNSDIGSQSKINHLSYVGDSEVGRKVNIGAGVITCNYDGVNKHRTNIGDNAFIGSNCQLVAPVSIGENATIGAGSTITKDAPADQLTVARAQQKSVANWQRPKKKET